MVFSLSLSSVSKFMGLLCASCVLKTEYNPFIIHPSLLNHNTLSSLYPSPQSLSLNSQIVREFRPLFVHKLSIKANFVLVSPLSEAWDLIIVPFICLVNSWIKEDEAEHEWDTDGKPQLRFSRVSSPTTLLPVLRDQGKIYLWKLSVSHPSLASETKLALTVLKDGKILFQQISAQASSPLQSSSIAELKFLF